MQRNVLIVGVIVLLLLACFVCSVGMGRGGGVIDRFLPDIDLSGEDAGSADARLSPPMDLSAIRDEDDGDGCRLEGKVFIIAKETTCSFRIKASPDEGQRLRLTLTEGDTVSFELDQEESIIIESTLLPASGDPAPTAVAIDVFRNADEPEAILTFRDCTVPAPPEVGEGTPEPPPGPDSCRLTIP